MKFLLNNLKRFSYPYDFLSLGTDQLTSRGWGMFFFFLNNLIPIVAEKYSDFGGEKKIIRASHQKNKICPKKTIAPLEVDALIHVPFIIGTHSCVNFYH